MVEPCYKECIIYMRGIFFALSLSIILALSLLYVEPVFKRFDGKYLVGKQKKYFKRSMEEL